MLYKSILSIFLLIQSCCFLFATSVVDIEQAQINLSKAIQIQTVSDREFYQDAEFIKFIQFIKDAYPEVIAKLEYRQINNSILLKWPGLKSSSTSDSTSDSKSDNAVVIMAHYDVVPVEPKDITKWQQPPFSGAISQGAVWGRGAIDNKGNLIAVLEAVRTLLKEGVTPSRDVYIAIGQDEELSGDEGNGAIVKYFTDNNINISLVIDEGMPIISPGLFPSIQKSVASICVAEKGYASFRLTATGTSGHSSVGSNDNPIIKMATFLKEFSEAEPYIVWTDTLTDFFHGLAPYASSFFYEQLFKRTWLTQSLLVYKFKQQTSTTALLATTSTVTRINAGIKDNVVPTNAEAIVNFRIIPGDSITNLQSRLKAFARSFKVTVDLINEHSYEPVLASPTTSLDYDIISRALKSSHPHAVIVPNIMVAGSDSHHYVKLNPQPYIYRVTPFELGPEQLSIIHGTNEHIKITELANGIEFFMNFISNI